MNKIKQCSKQLCGQETKYDKLVAKVNNIDTSTFVLKTKYDTDKSDLEKIMPNISGIVTEKQIIMPKLVK